MDNKENVKNATFIVLEGINSEETYKMEDSLETESVAENSAENISENGKAYKCKHCEKSFDHKQSLSQHMKEDHENLKDHKCVHCGKLFTADRNMKRHIETVHEGQKNFQCEQCLQSFGLKQVLNRHNIENKHNNSGKDWNKYKFKQNKIKILETKDVFGKTDDNAVIKIESPWNINSIYEFYYYNCPTCTYKHNSKQDFVDHILNSHPESTDYLRNISDGSLSDILIPWNLNELVYENFEEISFI